MRSKVQRVKLADIAATVPNAIAAGPFGSNLVSRDYVESGVPVIRGQNLSGRWVAGEFAFVTPAKAVQLKSNTAKPGDIVFTQRGTLGQVSIVPAEPFHTYVVSQSQMKLTVDLTVADSRYVYYACTAPDFTAQVHNNAVAAGVPHINLSILRELEIPLPAMQTQITAADALAALDDRIDLLRQTNATLEAIAQALFKSWFIDFDPVRAKAEGREPEGMDAATAALFPAEFEEAEIGPIPKGWRLGTMREVCEIFDACRIPLSSKQRAEKKGPYPYYGAAALLDYVDDFLFDGIYLLLGEDGSVTNRDGTPITQYVWGKFWVNNHAHVLQGANGISTEHLMLALRGIDFTPYVTGAVQAKLNQANLFRIPFLIPVTEIANSFYLNIRHLYEKLRANTEQAKLLELLRDTLLPRLISGKLRLPEAQEAVKTVAA